MRDSRAGRVPVAVLVVAALSGSLAACGGGSAPTAVLAPLGPGPAAQPSRPSPSTTRTSSPPLTPSARPSGQLAEALSFRPVATQTPGGCPPGAGPAGTEYLPARDRASCYALEPAALVLTRLAAVKVATGDGGKVVLDLSFLPADQARVTELTSRVVGRQLALVAGGAVIVAPTIASPIGADAEIDGGYTAAQAEALRRELVGS